VAIVVYLSRLIMIDFFHMILVTDHIQKTIVYDHVLNTDHCHYVILSPFDNSFVAIAMLLIFI